MGRWSNFARMIGAESTMYMPEPIGPKAPDRPEIELLGANGPNGHRIDAGGADLFDEQREHFEERAAIAEFDGGLSRTEAELLAWDEVRTCVQCHRDTEGEADAVRVSGGGWLHLDKCYDAHFGFRQWPAIPTIPPLYVKE